MFSCFNWFLSEAADGLKYYDVVEGKGPVAEKGSTVQVCFSVCIGNWQPSIPKYWISARSFSGFSTGAF